MGQVGAEFGDYVVLEPAAEPKRDEYTVMVAVKVSVPAGSDVSGFWVQLPDGILMNRGGAFVGATVDDYEIESVEPYEDGDLDDKDGDNDEDD